MIQHRNHNVLKHERPPSLDTISRTKSLGTSGRGFSLIEATIALAVIGIMLTSIFALQQSSMQASYTANGRLQRILLLKNALYDPSIVRNNHDKEFTPKEQIKNPKTTITISKELVKQEKLKNYELEQFRARASWDIVSTREEALSSIRFIPSKKEGKS